MELGFQSHFQKHIVEMGNTCVTTINVFMQSANVMDMIIVEIIVTKNTVLLVDILDEKYVSNLLFLSKPK